MTVVNKTVPSLSIKRHEVATVIQARMRGYFVRRWTGAVPTQHITQLEKDLDATIWRLRSGLERAKDPLNGRAERDALYLYLEEWWNRLKAERV
tara:strand:- start:930 stop:1211 length:282 start_codon:yes stop_codon:yes gene_type:complete